MQTEIKLPRPAFWAGYNAGLAEQEEHFLWGNFLCLGYTHIIVSAPDVGKSKFCQQLAVAVGSQMNDFIGFELRPKHGRSLIIATEENAHRVNKGVMWMAKCYKTKLNNNVAVLCSDVRFEGSSKDDIIVIQDFDDLQKRLDDIFAKFSFDLVVYDVLNDAFALKGIDGNKNSEVRGLFKIISGWARKYEHACLLVHHTNKSAYKSSAHQASAQGAGSISGQTRCTLQLIYDKSFPSNCRYLNCTKGNSVPDDVKRKNYELSFDNQFFEATGRALTDKDIDALFSGGDISSPAHKEEQPHLTAVYWKDLLDGGNGLRIADIAGKIKKSVKKTTELVNDAQNKGLIKNNSGLITLYAF